jgi:hypothetical protein
MQVLASEMGHLHDALAGHRICLLVDTLDVPEALLLVVVIGSHDDGHNVELQPQARTQRRAHVLERGRQASTNEFGEVGVLVVLHRLDDVVGDDILTHAESIVEDDMLDRKVEQIHGVVNGEGYNRGVVVREDGGNTKVERLQNAW